jgi:hypothetical protein
LGEAFLENARVVPTLVSRADYDLVVYREALVPALASYPGVQNALLVGEEIRVDWTDGTSRTLFSPLYASSHSVSRDRPSELFADLVRFVGRSSN